MKYFKRTMVVMLVSAIVGCSSIQIETGTTSEEMADKNEIMAKQLRGDWSAKLSGAENDHVRAVMVKNYIDSVSTLIINYGYRVVNEWQRGNEGRGEKIKAAEMRQVVDAWVTTQKPILNAFEDNMEYGISLIHNSQRADLMPVESMDLLDSLAGQYYDTYSTIFYPNYNVEVYEEELRKAESRQRDFSDRLGAYFRKF